VSSNWEDVKARKEIQRMALELDPIVTDDEFLHREDRANFFTGGRLSEVVEFLGWQEAEKHPEVRRFLDRLGAMVAERDKVRHDLADALRLSPELSMDHLIDEARSVWDHAAEFFNSRAEIRRLRDDAREAGKALLEYTRKQRARIKKALAIADDYDTRALNYPTGDVVADFRAALTGESDHAPGCPQPVNPEHCRCEEEK
jgi:hypothetical protein